MVLPVLRRCNRQAAKWLRPESIPVLLARAGALSIPMTPPSKHLGVARAEPEPERQGTLSRVAIWVATLAPSQVGTSGDVVNLKAIEAIEAIEAL